MDMNLTAWEQEMFTVLASAGADGHMAAALHHLTAVGHCRCCHTFDVRDQRYPDGELGVVQYAIGSSLDGAWQFILWVDDAGHPYCVEETTEAEGEPPAPGSLLVRRTPYLTAL